MDSLALYSLAQLGYLTANAPQVIAAQTLTANAASVTFTTIPQTFSTLILVVSGRGSGTGTAGYDQIDVTWNGLTSGYNLVVATAAVQGSAVTLSTVLAAASTQCGELWNSYYPTAGKGSSVAHFAHYSDSTWYKSVIAQSYASDGGSAGAQAWFAGANASTAPITQLTLAPSAGDFLTGSLFTLYGT